MRLLMLRMYFFCDDENYDAAFEHELLSISGDHSMGSWIWYLEYFSAPFLRIWSTYETERLLFFQFMGERRTPGISPQFVADIGLKLLEMEKWGYRSSYAVVALLRLFNHVSALPYLASLLKMIDANYFDGGMCQDIAMLLIDIEDSAALSLAIEHLNHNVQGVREYMESVVAEYHRRGIQ